jgi:uncharacterized tellurite resistance protein B-like protein
MAGLFEHLLSSINQPDASSTDAAQMERVSAILLVEIARADHDIDSAERDEIARAIGASSALPAEEVDELIDEAMCEADATLSLHTHVSEINRQFDKQNKLALVEHMWRVALADGKIDQYEEYTIRKLCDLIHVKHRDFMQAKHRAIGK